MRLSFESDIKKMTADLRTINAKAIPQATNQALNRTGRGVKTDAVREVSRLTSIKQSEVRKQIEGPSDRFQHKATKFKPSAEVNASKGRARNLINFVSPGNRKPNHFNSQRSLKSGKRKYRAKGVRARAWGKTKTYDKTFIGTGKNSNTPLVFTRTSSNRTPLKSVIGPSIRNTFDAKPLQAKLRSMAAVRFQKNMAAAVRNQLRRAQLKAG